ncbi:MAG: choice-of-anchor tandem repeat GloVer-containing protein [Steroidobacteraceae bacterium]
MFKITPGGKLTTVYSFCSQTNCTDGVEPIAGLIQEINGDFYGTTCCGGANPRAGYGGTVLKITPDGKLTTLYSFCLQTNCTDGDSPAGGLIQATDGNLYGTTYYGGANSTGCESEGLGCGTVFSIDQSGTLTTLHSFCTVGGSACTDGYFPRAGLVQATNGNFYGTTEVGGANDGGTVFEITPSGTLTTLYSFCSQTNCTDGGGPEGGLIQATDGNFYGTTEGGGANAEAGGTVFEITPSGTLTTLYSFCSTGGSACTDGDTPVAGLIQSTNGVFYGTTEYGGANGGGVVFSLSVGLRPFVETQTTSGKVGAAVNILGSDLTGATKVAFNGTAATFTVISASEIATTVPAGATTGFVEVTTPSGKLKSNTKYRVKP